MARFSNQKIQRNEIFVIASLIIFAAMIFIGGAYIGMDKIWLQIKKIDPVIYAILLSLSLINYFLRSLRWHLFQKTLGIKNRFFETCLFFFAGFALTTTPGKIGEALRLWFLEKKYNLRYEKTVSLLLGDKLSDTLAMLALSILAITQFDGYKLLALFIGFGLIGLTLLFMNPKILISGVNFSYARLNMAKRLFAKLRTALRQTAKILKFKIFTISLGLAIIGWMAECLAFYILLDALGSQITLLQAIFIFAFSMLVGGISMLPGGLGGTEATMFTLLLLIHTDLTTAAAATAIIRITTLWFAITLGFFCLPFALKEINIKTKDSR